MALLEYMVYVYQPELEVDDCIPEDKGKIVHSAVEGEPKVYEYKNLLGIEDNSPPTVNEDITLSIDGEPTQIKVVALPGNRSRTVLVRRLLPGENSIA